jgi:cell division transport system permease protein
MSAVLARRSADIPFDRDGSGRFLPWLIALMVYLAALAAAGALVAGSALEGWERGLAGTLTVELPPAPATGADDLQAALVALRAAPGVVAARALGTAEIAALLAPWLGPDVPPDLALPRLIDLHIDTAVAPDLAALRQRLARAAPDASLDDDRQWLAPAAALVHGSEALALGIVLLIAGAAVLSVVFATRTGLAVHRDAIELLHLMGAHDAYIVAEFERRALTLGLVGGALGLALAYATLLPLGRLAAPAGLAPAPWHLAVLAVLPMGAALLAAATARRTVGRALRRMP